MAAPLDIGQEIVASHHARVFLTVHGMKIRRVLRQRRMLLPIQVVIESVTTTVALVGDGDAGGFPEGHGPVTVSSSAVGGDADGKGDEGEVDAVADPEKIADGALDAGVLL